MTMEGVSGVKVVGGAVQFQGRESYWSMRCVHETAGSEAAFPVGTGPATTETGNPAKTALGSVCVAASAPGKVKRY